MSDPVRIELLGGLRARLAERVVTRFRTQKAAALLAYLAYFRERAHPREVLIELLWPDASLDAGRHNLSMALGFLRQVLEPPTTGGGPGAADPRPRDDSLFLADRLAIGLNAARVTTDVAAFEAGLRAAGGAPPGEREALLAAALDLYAGDLLPGQYEEWIFPEQQRLEELFFQGTRRLVTHLQAAGEIDRAVDRALRAVAANRLCEEAHQDVIRLHTAAGRPAAALRQYRELERILDQELGIAPSAATRALLTPAHSAGPGAAAEPAAPPAASLPRSEQLEPVGGAVPLGSSLYVARPVDAEFRAAVARQDGIVVLKGPRQVGKTSLLARGLQQAREAGARVVLSNFQVLSAADLASSESLLRALAEMLAEQLDLETDPQERWAPHLSATLNFQRYLRRHALEKTAGGGQALVWGMDEVDRLFPCGFASEVFGLFRSWHDQRALEPDGPWSRFTLALACSTEAHLFISDLNQSPFNVGTRLALEDFTPEQVADLNARYGSPIGDAAGLARYYGLVGGQPYLTRRGLHEMAARGISLAALEAGAAAEEGIFGEHLRRTFGLLAREPALHAAVRRLAEEAPNDGVLPEALFYRLRSAGVLAGEAPRSARFRCGMYAAYFRSRLAGAP